MYGGLFSIGDIMTEKEFILEFVKRYQAHVDLMKSVRERPLDEVGRIRDDSKRKLISFCDAYKTSIDTDGIPIAGNLFELINTGHMGMVENIVRSWQLLIED